VPIIGGGNGWWSFVHIEDAAAATALTIERIDDEPAPVRDWLPGLAATLGAKPPRQVPAWLGRLVAVITRKRNVRSRLLQSGRT
jgi:2-alkyl-3-oxoalkanoate reductase